MLKDGLKITIINYLKFFFLVLFIMLFIEWLAQDIPNTNLFKSALDKLTLASALTAAIATCFSAYSSSQSSKVAQQSLQSNQENTARNNFEQHYNSLFLLHNTLHKSVCEFLDLPDKKDRKGNVIVSRGKSYFSTIRQSGRLEDAHNILMGHSALSPYMRVLYHLLKHIFLYSDDPVIFKKYTSPLRSLIRNDVLYLVALNATIIYKDSSEMDNGYQEFQRYLQQCDFFEHTIFTRDEYKNFSEVRNELIKEFSDCIHIQIRTKLLNYIKKSEVCNNPISFPKDLLLCVIFNNPFSSDISEIYEAIPSVVEQEYRRRLDYYFNLIVDIDLKLKNICAVYQKQDKNIFYTLVDNRSCLRDLALDNKDSYTIFFVSRQSSGDVHDNCANVANWFIDLQHAKKILHHYSEHKQKIHEDLISMTFFYNVAFNDTTKRYKLF
ncbi:hypothetical protein ACKEWY_20565 [Yersinia enterocolitica]